MPTAQAPQPHPTRIALAHKADVDVATTSSLIRAVEKPAPKAESTQTRTSSSRSNWLIQLGATDEEEKARAILSRAREQGRSVLKQAEGFTEKVNKDGTTLYRARFSGFDEPNEAQAACKSLKRNGFSCFATRG
jgi:D-alanyl-D-alanine carboxypeptidase